MTAVVAQLSNVNANLSAFVAGKECERELTEQSAGYLDSSAPQQRGGVLTECGEDAEQELLGEIRDPHIFFSAETWSLKKMYFPQPRERPRKDAEWNHLEGIWQPVRKVERFRTDCRPAV